MKACLVGAYPPSLGDASLHAYWAARGLAERGHQLFVVTDSPAGQQCHIDEGDRAWHQPAFAASDGFVRVFLAGGPDRQPGDPAPDRPARLARCAAAVIEESGCGAVVASADEPYAAAGYLAARQVGRPLLIPPAETGHPVPAHVFHPDADPLPPAEIDRLAAACARRPGGPPRPQAPRFDPALSCIGSYDEPGSLLSASRLLTALASLRTAGLRVGALLMTDPGQHGSLWPAVSGSGLADSVWLLPVLPHWRLAGFIRCCTAVCCLGAASQGIAAEVLACGSCLVVPERSLASLPLGAQLEDGASAVVLAGPGAGTELARRLRMLAERPETTASIGAAGLLVSRKFPAYPQLIDAWEARLRAMVVPVGRPPRRHPGGRLAGLEAGPDLLVEASAAAARTCQDPGWLQFGLRPATGRAELYAALRAVSAGLLDAGLVSDFFFMHKPPGIRLRFCCAAPARHELAGRLRESLAGWERSGLIGGWRAGVYEPEEQLFGGPVSMRSVHRIFTADSLAWLGYHAVGTGQAAVADPAALTGPEPAAVAGPAWAMSLLLVRALLDALRIVGWEDLDVWDRLRRQAGRRLSPAMAARPELARLTAALGSAWSDRRALAALLSPAAAQLAGAYRATVLEEGKRWRAGYLASGEATVGARELAAFLIVFHWNRAGLSAVRQALLTEALLASRPGAGR